MSGQVQGFCASVVSAAVARSRLSSLSSRECAMPLHLLLQLVKNAMHFYLLFTTTVMLILSSHICCSSK